MLPWTIVLVMVSLHVSLSHARTLYVKTNESDSSPCPDSNNVECETLDWYSKNVSGTFTNDTVMVFLEGSHLLQMLIKVTNCSNFTMIGNGMVVYTDNNRPQPTTWISCNGGQSATSAAGLLFINSSQITITKLGLESCSANASLELNLDVYFGLAFRQGGDILLNTITINNTAGFGLQCDNVHGNIQIMNSVFSNSHGIKNGNSSQQFGGNARFWFGDQCTDVSTNVTIDNSSFLYGLEVQKNTNTNASGLQIYINCQLVNVSINNITAKGNKGVTSGNLALTIIDTGSNVSTIHIQNSQFIDGSAAKGGGIRFWSLINNTGKSNSSVKEKVHVKLLTIVNCTFRNNSARSTGGAIYIAHYVDKDYYSHHRQRQIEIINCTFQENTGGNGAVMEVLKQTFPDYISHLTPQFSVNVTNCTIENNGLAPDNKNSIVAVIGTKSMIVSYSTFRNNSGSVISLRNCNLRFEGEIHFVNNNAAYGGALRVCGSSLVFLHKGTNVFFTNNTAQKGGAIYAQQGCLDSPPACLFQPAVPNIEYIEEFGNLMKLKFINNSAHRAGDAIYGGSFDHCFTIRKYMSHYNRRHSYFYCKRLYHAILDTSKQMGQSCISSDPQGVCFCDHQGIPNCRAADNSHKELDVFPGQSFSVSITAIGQGNKTTIGLIDAHLVERHSSVLISINNSLVSRQGCTNLTYKVSSQNPPTILTVNFSAVTNNINAYYTPINTTAVLYVHECPFGFKLIDGVCSCDPLLLQLSNQVQCSIDKQQILIPANTPSWFGCINVDDDDAGGSNESLCYLATSALCNYHCSSDALTLDVSNRTTLNTDDQCLPGRTGIVCGACKEGLSRVLGEDTKCKPCSHLNLLFLIPTFLLSGLAMVALLTFLNVTITEGTIGGVIFYANIVYTHRYLFANDHQKILSKLCRVFVSWLNFDVGFELCFFNGLTGYQQIWLSYGYIFYLMALQATIIFLCRRFIFFTRLFGRHVVKVLATVTFLMYSPLTNAIIQTLTFNKLSISQPNGTETRLVWYYDGNVQYLGTKHTPLFVVSLLCLAVMMWLTFSLLLIQCLQKRANLFCFKWVEKLRPFFEAFTGPCHDNYRFWPGFLLLMRLGLYALNTVDQIFTYSTHQKLLTSFGTSIACVVMLAFSCIFPRGVYKKWLLNVLEFSFLLNLCITSALWTVSGGNNSAVMYTSVLIAVITFLGIVTFHLGEKMKHKFRSCSQATFVKLADKFNITRRAYFPPADDTTTPLFHQRLPQVTNNERYRESLIGTDGVIN